VNDRRRNTRLCAHCPAERRSASYAPFQRDATVGAPRNPRFDLPLSTAYPFFLRTRSLVQLRKGPADSYRSLSRKRFNLKNTADGKRRPPWHFRMLLSVSC